MFHVVTILILLAALIVFFLPIWFSGVDKKHICACNIAFGEILTEDSPMAVGLCWPLKFVGRTKEYILLEKFYNRMQKNAQHLAYNAYASKENPDIGRKPSEENNTEKKDWVLDFLQEHLETQKFSDQKSILDFYLGDVFQLILQYYIFQDTMDYKKICELYVSTQNSKDFLSYLRSTVNQNIENPLFKYRLSKVDEIIKKKSESIISDS
ncbi:hypothetical protein EDEG_03385 [Edhazardia aedis USNM 41457]|uniref:Uncharacterized protein n=1 Tax=Edhazardia aedis (strain USNM 41457) TaxID=1003232 RepID=J9DHS9_EDHAE|nr:hypothetical protein EDEG_03385 [Edhazardia aedis USNM 41457]|eukprot:EJW02170.1 hypothetical protein EDEG_03385 [Edhazardia aedis USNM 41457]